MNINPQQETNGDKIATVAKQVGAARGVLNIVKTIFIAVIMVIMALIFMGIGAPWFIWAVMLFGAAGIIILAVVSSKRNASVNLAAPSNPVSAGAEIEPGEHIMNTIPAVMEYGKARSTSVLGTGIVHTPENALLISNKAVWALTVPLLGADKVISGVDIGMNQFMWAANDIDAKLQEMISTLPLDEILKQGRAKRLMGVEEIKLAKTYPLSQNISLKRADGKKYRYSIRRKEDYIKAKEIFKIQ